MGQVRHASDSGDHSLDARDRRSLRVAAQSSDQRPVAPQSRMVYVPGRGTVLVQPVPTGDPRAVAHTVIVPGLGEVYAVPVRPKDARSPRQICVEEAARIGGTLSDLDRRSIDLKCSQR